MAVATANDQKGTKGKGTEWEQRELPNRSSAVVMSPLEDDLWEDYYAVRTALTGSVKRLLSGRGWNKSRNAQAMGVCQEGRLPSMTKIIPHSEGTSAGTSQPLPQRRTLHSEVPFQTFSNFDACFLLVEFLSSMNEFQVSEILNWL